MRGAGPSEPPAVLRSRASSSLSAAEPRPGTSTANLLVDPRSCAPILPGAPAPPTILPQGWRGAGRVRSHRTPPGTDGLKGERCADDRDPQGGRLRLARSGSSCLRGRAQGATWAASWTRVLPPECAGGHRAPGRIHDRALRPRRRRQEREVDPPALREDPPLPARDPDRGRARGPHRDRAARPDRSGRDRVPRLLGRPRSRVRRGPSDGREVLPAGARARRGDRAGSRSRSRRRFLGRAGLRDGFVSSRSRS